MDTELKLSRSKTKLLLFAPFFGAVAAGLECVESDKPGRLAATDGKRIFYNAEFVDKISQDELTGVVAHEALHVAWKHHLRRNGREHELWNIANDYAINGVLLKEGFVLPEERLYNKKFDNWSSERIYNYLLKNSEERPSAPCSWGGVLDQTGKDGKPLSAEERALEETKVDQKVIKAGETAKELGNIPGFLDEYLKSLREPSVDWLDVLRRFAVGDQPDDLSMRRVDRRAYHLNGTIMPSIDRIGLGHFVGAIDSSGSLAPRELEQFQSEFNAIINEFNPLSVTIIICDTHVRDVQRYEQGQTIDKLKVPGRGGTRVKPVFEYIEREGLEVDKLVYFTDLCVSRSDFPRKPDYPVLWATTMLEHAPFGEVVKVKVN